MAQVINTNIMSLNAQRNLNNTAASLGNVVQRLSSGLRINSAKDDAAGLAIASRFSTQVRGLTVAARNANDGISLAQTAEGAMGEITENLQRIRELAVQARNATNSVTDRQALNAEVQQLKEEIQRVAEQTNFNGLSLLNGSFQDQAFQVGANVGQTITVANLANANTNALGAWTTTIDDRAYEATTSAAIGFTDPEAASSVTINGATISIGALAARTAPQATAEFIAAFDAAKQNNSALQNLTISNTGEITAAAGFQSTDLTFTNATNITGYANVVGARTASTGYAAGNANGFANAHVLTEAGADNIILSMDAALSEINARRAELGAVQNRFTSAVRNIDTTAENLTASRSRIMDTDYARETSELTRTQILQQAGTAMLAQAKALPQSVLQLLQ